jgi:hypothetical protein
MRLFDDIPRPDMDVPDQHEAAFSYLNRSGRPEAARVRQLVEDWLARYPAHDRDALIVRLRSTIADQHRGAFFELFVYELLLARGHRILEIEPKLPHTSKSPDFLVQAKEGHRLYLECVLATGRSQPEVAAQAKLNQALTALDRTPSPRHFLDLTVRRPARVGGTSTPSVAPGRHGWLPVLRAAARFSILPAEIGVCHVGRKPRQHTHRRHPPRRPPASGRDLDGGYRRLHDAHAAR